MILPTSIELKAHAASCGPLRRPPPLPGADLRECWRQLQARVALAERVLACCDQEPVITGTPRR